MTQAFVTVVSVLTLLSALSIVQLNAGSVNVNARLRIPACKDQLYECDLWKHFYRCHYDQETQLKCPKTCGLCTPGDSVNPEGQTPHELHPNHRVPPLWTQEEECGDYEYACPAWAEMGYCRNRSEIMWSMCRRSCGLCRSAPDREIEATDRSRVPQECKRFKKRCLIMAKMQYCTREPRIINKECHGICGKCHQSLWGDLSPRKAVEHYNNKCEDKYEHCDELFFGFGEGEFCRNHASYAAKRCAKTCDFCGGKIFDQLSAAEAANKQQNIYSSCRDVQPECEKYAKMGLCGKSDDTPVGEVMTYYCRKTCQKCTLVI